MLDGEVLLELERPGDALEHFAAALGIYPSQSVSLLGATRANRALGGYQATLKQLCEEPAKIFRGADQNRPALAEARRFLSM